MIAAEGIILASPTYVGDVSSQMKALMDRLAIVTKFNGDLLKRTVGAAIVTARRGGALHTFNSLNNFFLIQHMVVAGSSYWNDGLGLQIGDVEGDAESKQMMIDPGQNMAWLLKRLHS